MLHSAAPPQPKLWSSVLFGVRQLAKLAAAFVRVELLRLRKSTSKLAHSKEDAPRMLEKPCQVAKDFRLHSIGDTEKILSPCLCG